MTTAPAVSSRIVLDRTTNQAAGIAKYAIDFLREGAPSEAVRNRTVLFHTDATLCGLSALAHKCTAPRILHQMALDRPAGGRDVGAMLFGSSNEVDPVMATLAGVSAVREWDSNGTNFGYRVGDPNQQAGEFGHNDYYPAVIAACQAIGLDGTTAVCAMIAVDEIRDALARAFSLKTHKIDHVLHGGIAVAAVVGALYGLSAEQIESAIGVVVAHHVPTRAIRHGSQLSHSKGASAAITSKAAYEAVLMAKGGFQGPADIFRNSEAIFWLMEAKSGRAPIPDESPFDLELAFAGDDFAIMGMHFKLGVYEHQSAGAIQALIRLFSKHPDLARQFADGKIREVKVRIYGVAHHIISKPEKWNPTTRQSADHSMPYILNIVIHLAMGVTNGDFSWHTLMPLPRDYSARQLGNPDFRKGMSIITCEHQPEYDAHYPNGIPTSIVITDADGVTYDSGLVMFPGGHARNGLGEDQVDLLQVLATKHRHLASIAVGDSRAAELIDYLQRIESLPPDDLTFIYDTTVADRDEIDGSTKVG